MMLPVQKAKHQTEQNRQCTDNNSKRVVERAKLHYQYRKDQ